MKNGSLVFLIMLLIPLVGVSQNIYWVGFPDKSSNSFSIQHPEQYLSPKAIQRRLKQQISITEEDLPVSQHYVDSIKKTGAEILFPLKWLNGVVVKPSVIQLEAIQKMKFPITVTSIYEEASGTPISGIQNHKTSTKIEFNKSYYGNGYSAITNISGNYLHQKGFMGQGMLIAIIDDGFSNADRMSIFSNAFSQNRVIATKDFVNPHSNIFTEDSHGTHVLSIIAANAPTFMVGTAPEANFVLLRSENFDSEQLVEEYYWSAAAEYADSIGADITNTSLGYTTFDVPSQNHTYSDLTGETTPISISCSIAAKKGMLMICSAGNEGSSTWKYISVPADAKGVLTVGSINLDSSLSTFSSIGPTADGRVKPDVVALGTDVGIIGNLNSPSLGNGTSFSAPIITGMAACLWQAFPNLTSNQIREAIISTSSQYSNPNNSKGFGIPQARLAYYNLLEVTGESRCIPPDISPNPFSNGINITINAKSESETVVTIYTCTGELVFREQILISLTDNVIIPISKNLPKGIYIVNITCGECVWREKLVKQ